MKAFTLVETMVTVLIFSFLIAAIFAVMNTGRLSWFTGDTSVELRQEIIKAYMTMEREIRQTRPSQTDLTVNTTTNAVTFTLPVDLDADGTVLDTVGQVEWSGNITYALNGTNITRTAVGVTTVLGRNINSLEFTLLQVPLNSIQIDISAQKVSATGRTIQDSGQITVKMRN